MASEISNCSACLRVGNCSEKDSKEVSFGGNSFESVEKAGCFWEMYVLNTLVEIFPAVCLLTASKISDSSSLIFPGK